MKNKNKRHQCIKSISVLPIIFLLNMCVAPLEVSAECKEITFNGWIEGKGMGWPVNVEALADIRIDTSFVDSGARRVVFTILSISPVDTSIFYNPEYYFDSLPVSYDISGFILPHRDSFLVDISTNLQQGDTLRDMLILTASPRGGEQKGFALSKTCFLTDTNPSFPFNQALSLLNRYLDSNSIYKGYDASSTVVMKLGPVFWGWGDPGWKLTAYNDSSYWYIDHHAGDGDCPMGCIGGMDATYRISSSGVVERVACTSYSATPSLDYCAPASIRNDKPVSLTRGFKGNYNVYDLSGRLIGRISSAQFNNGTRGMSLRDFKPGVYIFKPENNSVQSLLRLVVY